MVKQVIDIGAEPNDGTGDPLRDAFIKTNQNFTELYNSDKASFDAANAAFAVANAAGGFTIGGIYTQANTAYFVANAAFDRANSVGGAGIAGAFDTANASFRAANAAFAVANNSTTANIAFDRANIAINNVNYVNVIAIAAFVQSNAAFDSSNLSYAYANVAISQSNLAVTRANAAFNGVGAAFDTANLSLARANSASNTANATQNTAIFAYRTANAAFDFANTITGGGGGGGGIIGDSSNIAIAAFRTANAAFDKANTGGGGNGANAFANTTGTFEGDLTVKGNTIFLSDIYVNPSIRENVTFSNANSLVIHGTTFGFGTDMPNEYDGWTVVTVGGKDSAFPYGSPASGRHGDIIWLTANGNYMADFYTFDEGAGQEAFQQYYAGNVNLTLASSTKQFNFQSKSVFYQPTRFYALIGYGRDDPGYQIDVVGTINASAVLVNGLPITGGGGSTLDAANAAFAQANTANLLAFRANVNAAAAFAQANAAFTAANIAIANVNFVNVEASAAFAQANIAYGIANTALTAYTGNVSYSDAGYAFLNNSGVNTTTAGWQKVPLDTKLFDDTFLFDVTSNSFIARKPGYYTVHGRARTTTAGLGAVGIAKNGNLHSVVGSDTGAAQLGIGGSTIVYLNGATDNVSLFAFSTLVRTYTTGQLDTYLTLEGPLVTTNSIGIFANSLNSSFNTANNAYNTANAAFNKANLWLLSSNVAPVSAIANSFWFNTDTAELYVYFTDWDGTSQWVQTNGSLGGGQALKDINYYLMFYYPGFVDSNVSMYVNNVPTKFYLPANLAGSYATVETAPSGNNANLRIQKNGAFIGNISFARNNTNGTFVFTNTVTFDKGDKIKIISPITVDPTMSDISISLVGVKTE